MLEKIHQNPTLYDADSLIPHIKKWTLDWREFLISRSILYVIRTSNAYDLIKLVAEIEDRNTVRRELEKKNKRGATLPGHPKALKRPNQQHQANTQPWTAINRRNGKVMSGRENPPEHGAADRNANARSDLGFDSLMGTHERYEAHYPPRPRDYNRSQFTETAHPGSLKMQAEIDSLKCTLNELTLKAALPI
jgi:hypothetical protein